MTRFEEIENLNAALELGQKYYPSPNNPGAVVKYSYITLANAFCLIEFEALEKDATEAEAIFKKKQFLIEKELADVEECQRELADRHYKLRKKLEALKK